MFLTARHPRSPGLLGLLGAGFLISALTLACRSPAGERLFTFSGQVMGTRFNVRVVASGLDPAARAELERRVAAELSAVDDLMTTYRDSEVTRFNRWQSGEPFAVSAATSEVVTLALELARQTGGAFDITVAPLVEAFGFGASGRREEPSAVDLETLRARVGYRHLSIASDGRLLKQIPELEIDLSAVAKGFGVDRAADSLDQLGIDNYMIEVGGEVRAKGANERGERWRIGIEQPDTNARAAHRIVSLADMALATSGDYRDYREVDGRRLSHLIDPRTGAPIEHRVASATVLHPDCATADALATAMMVLGEAGLELAESRGWAVLLIAREEDHFIELESSAFRLLVESARPENA